jgi:hypothetical protein
MQHLMFAANYTAYPGLWEPGWWLADEEDYPLSEELARDISIWIDTYEREHVCGSPGSSAWLQEGHLLVARLNAELMPRGYAVWPAFDLSCQSPVLRRMGADFREERLAIDDAQLRELVVTSNELLAKHHLPLIPITESDAAH